MAQLHVEVVSTTEVIWKGYAKQVSVPGVEGQIGILPGRQPLMALLTAGVLTITPVEGEPVQLSVPQGFVSVDQDEVTVCVNALMRQGLTVQVADEAN